MELEQVVALPKRTWLGEWWRFLIIGCLNAAVDFLVYLSLTRGFGWWEQHYLWANALAFWLANINSFVWNRLWTFNAYESRWFKQYAAFLSTSLIYLAFIQLGLWLLVSYLGWFDLLAKVVVIGLGMILYFIVLKKLVFWPPKQSKDNLR